MANEEFDPFHTSTGLLEAFTWTIGSGQFGTDAQYGGGASLFCEIEGKTDDETVPEFSKRYSCGKGWEATAGGRVAEGKKYFVKSSGYGLFLNAAMATSAVDVLRERQKTTHPQGPMDASIWDGLIFRMESVEQNYGGEIGKKDVILPAEFLGVVGGSTKASSNGSGTLSPKLRAQLTKLASECDDFESFVNRGFTEIDGVDGDNAAESAVMDESPNGIFAKAHA